MCYDLFSRGVISHKCLSVLPVAKYRFKNTHRIKQTHLFFKKWGFYFYLLLQCYQQFLKSSGSYDEKEFGGNRQNFSSSYFDIQTVWNTQKETSRHL